MRPQRGAAGWDGPISPVGWIKSAWLEPKRSRIKKDVWRSCPAPGPAWGSAPSPSFAEESRNPTRTFSISSKHQLSFVLAPSAILPPFPALLLNGGELPPTDPHGHAGGRRSAATKPGLYGRLTSSAGPGQEPQLLHREHPPVEFPDLEEASTISCSSGQEATSQDGRRGARRPLEDLKRSTKDRRRLPSRNGSRTKRSTVACLGLLHQVLGPSQLRTSYQEASEA